MRKLYVHFVVLTSTSRNMYMFYTMAMCSSCHCTGVNDEITLWQLCQGQATQRIGKTQLSTPYIHCLHSTWSRNNGTTQTSRMGVNNTCGGTTWYSMITNLLIRTFSLKHVCTTHRCPVSDQISTSRSSDLHCCANGSTVFLTVLLYDHASNRSYAWFERNKQKYVIMLIMTDVMNDSCGCICAEGVLQGQSEIAIACTGHSPHENPTQNEL